MTDSADNLRRFVNLYRSMARIRAFEETALEAHKAGEIGPLHVSIGQEAVAAGVCANLRRDGRLTSNHRGHGHALAKAPVMPRPSSPGRPPCRSPPRRNSCCAPTGSRSISSACAPSGRGTWTVSLRRCSALAVCWWCTMLESEVRVTPNKVIAAVKGLIAS